MRSILSNVESVKFCAAAGVGVIVLAATACGSGESGSTSAREASTPTVVASTSIWADITSNVACDGLADVVALLPLGADPHSFEVSLKDRETMENSALIVANGLLLEESLADTIDAVESGGTPVLEVGEHLDTLDFNDEPGQASEGDDPHVWFDPTRVAAALPVIADALEDIGIDRVALDSCVATYENQLMALDKEVLTIVAELSPERRFIVANHDALGYFADRYELEILGSVIPSSSTLAETNPAELEELAMLIESHSVNAIFTETQESSPDAEALARRVGDIAIVELLTGTLDEPGSPGATYIGWLRQNALLIVEGLR